MDNGYIAILHALLNYAKVRLLPVCRYVMSYLVPEFQMWHMWQIDEALTTATASAGRWCAEKRFMCTFVYHDEHAVTSVTRSTDDFWERTRYICACQRIREGGAAIRCFTSLRVQCEVGFTVQWGTMV